MADLPMAQIPNFQLPGPAPIQNQPGLAQGIAQGLPQGMNMAGVAQNIRLQQAQIQQMQTQQHLQVVDSLLKNGIEYPALMKALWPTIATNMNKISPDYSLNPSQPPEDLGGIFKFLSGTSDALQAGAITMPQAHTVVKQGIQDFKGTAVPPEGLSEPSPDQGLPGQAGYQQKFNQLLDLGPTMAQKGLPMLEATPEAMQMKSALEQQKSMALQKSTFQNENMQSLNRTFLENTKDQAQQLPDLIDFTTSMSPRLPPNPTPQDKADLVVHQKIGLLKYMQLNVPASRRPPNLQAMDNISREDLVQAHAEQAWKQLFKTGAPLTEEQQDAILKNGVATGLASEKILSDAESSWASRAKNNEVDPLRALQNIRPSSLPSTSKFFPNPGPNWQTAHVGQIVVSPTGPKVYRGGDRSDPKNWTSIGQ